MQVNNKLLKPNEGKNGSYTIIVKKDYAVPKEPLSEVITEIMEHTRKRKALKAQQWSLGPSPSIIPDHKNSSG